MCEQECESGWSEAEAIAEKERDFGDVPLEECDQVCDDCYQQVSPQNNPEYYASYIAAEKPIRFNTPLPSTVELADTETIREYVDAELSRKLAEWFDEELEREFFGVEG
jgi:hypothetical protein